MNDKDNYKSNNSSTGEMSKITLPDEELKKIVPSLNAQEAKKISRFFLNKFEISRFHSGPLPPPETLAGYEKIKKGYSERVIKMAEKEQGFRHSFSEKIRGDEKLFTILGIGCGFIIAMTALIGGIYLALSGCSLVGFAAIVGALAALVAAFIYGKTQNDKTISHPQSEE